MSEDGWFEAKSIKNRQSQRQRWKNYISQAPHIVTPSRALRIRQRLNIQSLDEKLLSDKWIEYQISGWIYVKVVRPDDQDSIPEGEDYSTLSVENSYGDVVLFKRSPLKNVT